MRDPTQSPAVRTPSPAAYAYDTETKSLKMLFVGLSVLVLVVFVPASLYLESSVRMSVVTGLIFAAAVFAFLWIYGARAVFERSYRIDSEGVSVSRRGIRIQAIRWSDVQSITGAHMVVHGACGNRIAFNIPPSEQRKARSAIDEWIKKAAQPGATDNPDDAQRLRENH